MPVVEDDELPDWLHVVVVLVKWAVLIAMTAIAIGFGLLLFMVALDLAVRSFIE